MLHEVFWKNPGYKVRESLTGDITCDYLIVGGGITGVALAYFLSSSGAKNIVLVEKGFIGDGATGKSAGILTVRGELDLTQIIKLYGRKKGLAYWDINKEGLSLVASIVKKEKLNCDFELQDTLFGSISDEGCDYVLKEYLEEKKIEKSSCLLTGEAIKKEIISPLFKQVVISKNHAISVNPRKHVQSLSEAVAKKGVRIYEHTGVSSIRGSVAQTAGGNITFKKIIRAVDVFSKVKDIRNRKSTIAISEPLSKKQIASIGLSRKKIIWDSEQEYHYLKLTKEGRLMVGFGDKILNKKHNRTIPLTSHFREIERFIKKIFPQLEIEIAYAWSGIFGTTDNLIPSVQKTQNGFVIGGAGSQIMCVVLAKHIADVLLNRKTKLDSFFG